MKKYLFLIIAIAFLVLLVYRTYQYRAWSKAHPMLDADSVYMAMKDKPKAALAELQIRKSYDPPFLPDDYRKPMLLEKPIIKPLNDTIFINGDMREIVEFLFIGKPMTRFSDLDIRIGEEHKKPSITKDGRGSYYLSSDTALFVFHPWVGDKSDLEVTLSYNYAGANLQARFPIKVLFGKEYQKYISNRLNVNDRLKWQQKQAYYEGRLDKSRHTEWRGRKMGYLKTIDLDYIFKGNHYRPGRYSNQYVAQDGMYTITVTSSDNPTISVEPINQIP